MALPRLVLDLAAAGHTGELALARGRDKARVLWLRGMPVGCELEPAGPGLVDLLAERGTLSAADADKVRAALRKKPGAEEAALLQLGVVAPRDLVVARRELIARRIVSLGRLESGTFDAKAAEAAPNASDLLRVDPLPVVQRMLAAHWRPDRMLSDLEAKLRLFPAPSPAFAALAARIEPGPTTSDLAAAIDGTRSAWSLVSSAADPARIAALWVLDACGALAWSETALVAAPEAAAAAESPVARALDEPMIEIEVVGAVRAERATPDAAAARSERAEAAKDHRSAELRAEIGAQRARLGERDFYELLGIERSAKAAEVKRAYLKAAKRYHPDALSRLGLEDLKREANELFAAITEAHTVLSDAKRRAEYDAGLAGHVAIDADRVAQAESLYRKAELLMRAGNFVQAFDFAQGAVNLWPEDPAYQAALGWCLYKRVPPEPERALQHLEKSIALDANEAAVHLRLGIVLKALGDNTGAARASARGKQLDSKARP